MRIGQRLTMWSGERERGTFVPLFFVFGLLLVMSIVMGMGYPQEVRAGQCTMTLYIFPIFRLTPLQIFEPEK